MMEGTGSHGFLRLFAALCEAVPSAPFVIRA